MSKLTSQGDSHNITGLKASLRITGMTPASHADALRMASQIEPQKPGRTGDGCVALLDQAIVSGEVRLCWHAQDLDPGAAIRRRLVLARSARLSCSPNGPRRTWASCPGTSPPSRDTISLCSHDHSPLRRGGVRPAIPRILTSHARGAFRPGERRGNISLRHLSWHAWRSRPLSAAGGARASPRYHPRQGEPGGACAPGSAASQAARGGCYPDRQQRVRPEPADRCAPAHRAQGAARGPAPQAGVRCRAMRA